MNVLFYSCLKSENRRSREHLAMFFSSDGRFKAVLYCRSCFLNRHLDFDTVLGIFMILDCFLPLKPFHLWN